MNKRLNISEEADLKKRLRNKQAEIRELKKELEKLRGDVGSLDEQVVVVSEALQQSVELSVDFLYDLEYFKYKSSFIDIDIKLQPGSANTLKSYGKNIKKFFLEELRCTYLFISCSGINKSKKDILKIDTRRKLVDSTEFLMDRSTVYYIDLQDLDLPERILGRIILGRHPYKDQKKEERFDEKIKEEIFITKRLLENSISAIQNKELAVLDALTGLNTRKLMEERLAEEFKSLDFFTRLSPYETGLLQLVLKADGQPRKIIRNLFYNEHDTNDESLFNETVGRLLADGLISRRQERFLGEIDDFFYFESSKMKYNLFIAMFDLDHFKDVNDNWGGHDVGDRILKMFAGILKKNIRTMDMPVRYGGEEFIVLFPRVASSRRIIETLERIRLECERVLIVEKDGNSRNVTTSIGVTQISKYDHSIEQIVKRADEALYRAKRQRNRIIFYEQGSDGYIRVL